MSHAEFAEYGGVSILESRVTEVRALLREGKSNLQIGKALGASPDAVGRFIREFGLVRPISSRAAVYREKPPAWVPPQRKPLPKPTPKPYARTLTPVEPGAEKLITVKVIDFVVGGAEWLGVPVADFISPDRRIPLARPRMFAMYLARELTGASLPLIGGQFGGRDHSTVINAVRNVKRAMLADPETINTLSEIHRYAAAHALSRGIRAKKLSEELGVSIQNHSAGGEG